MYFMCEKTIKTRTLSRLGLCYKNVMCLFCQLLVHVNFLNVLFICVNALL
mgnify:CR=1 FL=1